MQQVDCSGGDLGRLGETSEEEGFTRRRGAAECDRWQVESVVDGSMHVTHLASRRHVELPAAYVERHVELGYATTIHLAQGRTADTCHTVLTGRETRELLYVAMTRGRDGNHLYLDTGTAGDPHDATTPDSVRPPSSVEILERILARHEDDPSATTAHRRDLDPSRRLQIAVERYAEAVVIAGAGPLASPGPLPWLPPRPDVNGELGTYLDQRDELVRTLAGAVSPTSLPDQPWADQLRTEAPDLARELAVWRAATGSTDRQDPFGEPDHDALEYRSDLVRRVEAVVGPCSNPTDRWRAMIAALEPRVTADPSFAQLAAAFDRAAAAGLRRASPAA